MNDVINGISVLAFPINVRYSGAKMASNRLLSSVKAVAEAMLPPSNPTTTGADVAVGANTHIIVACASVSFTFRNNRYIIILPKY